MIATPPPVRSTSYQAGAPRFVAPPQDEPEIYPYRRVWISIIVENTILFAVTLGIYIAVTAFGVSIPQTASRPVNAAIALLPAGLWLVFSWLRERFAVQPRQQLLSVAMVSALAANAIGIPFVEAVFQPEAWLPLESLVNRIVGYTVTVIVVQEVLKYIVIRSIVWREHFRIREDSIAYGAASAVGYAVVVNLHFAFGRDPLPQIMAARTFEMAVIGLICSLIIAFALSELRFARPSPLLPVSLFALACVIGGGSIALRSAFVNPAFTFRGAQPNDLLGIILTAVVLLLMIVFVAFLFRNAVRQEREAAARAEV